MGRGGGGGGIKGAPSASIDTSFITEGTTDVKEIDFDFTFKFPISTSGGCPQFPKRFSGKEPFHLTLNRKFRIFWLNGNHHK